MSEAADLVVTNAEVHTLGDPDETHEAMAVRDGRVVRLGTTYDVEFLAGAETATLDAGSRVVLPGFVDAHTHLLNVGSSLVHADLSGATSPGEAVRLLEERADEVDDDEWVLGFGYDESTWAESRYLTRDDLAAVSSFVPVVAFREDMHVASVNDVVLDRLLHAMPDGDVLTEGGDPTGVVVEEAVDPVREMIEPDAAEARRLVEAAQEYANERGVTGVHDMVRKSKLPGAYRAMDLDGDLTLRVRINYWADHLDSLVDAGLRTNHGSEMVQVGAIKSFTDGSLGGRTAKLSAGYADARDETGQWVVDPEAVADLVARADAAGFQVSLHAIGDAAVDAALDAYAGTDAPGEMRHRVEHAELASDEAIERFADLGVVASMQPNFHKWGREDGLYDARLGDRRTDANRLPAYPEAGAPLAFGSDCMPLDPLFGVDQAVNAPTAAQSLGVTDALRAYTLGAAYAGFDEDRVGTLEAGKRADFVLLDDSPWERSEAIADIDVALTAVDGDVVYDDR
ncbi:amidohydrolase [Candidatus Halobonum tyrrellensis]|uniref:Tim-barrel fold metal-dependent hydrolase n=1 Tax=Candidatus Halobonum tyrrellensis G22 TaxID=1324957 RepID=V4HCR2_9EURY|nr:amidohydrolase [Candidatus Halobonum tyrrellensis]ESP87823.1 tim-barrel fold metal-dependent hydrolase [Candidatus Halobonum tyrrellensis G22]